MGILIILYMGVMALYLVTAFITIEAFTYFGLVPALVVGVILFTLINYILDRAARD